MLLNQNNRSVTGAWAAY